MCDVAPALGNRYRLFVAKVVDQLNGSYAINFAPTPTAAGRYDVSINLGTTKLLHESWTIVAGAVNPNTTKVDGLDDAQFHYLLWYVGRNSAMAR